MIYIFQFNLFYPVYKIIVFIFEVSSDSAPSMAVISGTESLDAPLDHPRDEGEDRTNLIINYLPQVE